MDEKSLLLPSQRQDVIKDKGENCERKGSLLEGLLKPARYYLARRVKESEIPPPHLRKEAYERFESLREFVPRELHKEIKATTQAVWSAAQLRHRDPESSPITIGNSTVKLADLNPDPEWDWKNDCLCPNCDIGEDYSDSDQCFYCKERRQSSWEGRDDSLPLNVDVLSSDLAILPFLAARKAWEARLYDAKARYPDRFAWIELRYFAMNSNYSNWLSRNVMFENVRRMLAVYERWKSDDEEKPKLWRELLQDGKDLFKRGRELTLYFRNRVVWQEVPETLRRRKSLSGGLKGYKRA